MALRRRRSGLLWLLCGFILGPIGLLLATRFFEPICPYCSHSIPTNVTLCPHCNADLQSPEG
jgi:predicted amidophosphoribosyltransferase